jgi:hypothetical protein
LPVQAQGKNSLESFLENAAHRDERPPHALYLFCMKKMLAATETREM